MVLRDKRSPNNNPISTEKILLGKQLYFDKRLSSDGTVSCATCHDPATAFASKEALAIGINGQKGTRNAPTLLNSVFSQSYFWDGRVQTLEEQVKQPLLNPAEMGHEGRSCADQAVEFNRRISTEVSPNLSADRNHFGNRR